MKKRYEEEDEEQEFQELDKAKLLVTVIPIVLILVILAVTVFVGTRRSKVSDTDKLQQDIMSYADKENQHEDVQESMSNTVVKAEEEQEREQEQEQESEPLSPTMMPDPTPTAYHPIMEQAGVDYSKIKYDQQKNLKEMMAYWADNNQAALDDLAALDWFRAMSWSLRNTTENYYYGSVNGAGKPEGMGIAVYGDNQYYYGEWKNGVRSGKGTWIHYHFHAKENTQDIYTYHQYVGMWREDLPDGEGQEHYDFNQEALKEGGRYISNRIGSYQKGLVNGEFYLTSIDEDGNMKEWEARASEGKWLYYGDAKDSAGRRPAYLELNPDNKNENYIWLLPKENVNVGVPCLISQNRKV